MCSRWHEGGRVRSTTPAEDRYIVLSAKRNRRTTAQQVANQFLAASGKQISRKTVARRLRGGGLYARRPVVCVPLTRQHRTARLQWCREHHNWTEQDWACVLFSDESRFSLSSDCRRQLIWRESGTRKYPRKGPIYDMQYHSDCLDSEGIQRLVWPARSPDLNPIENVWDALGRQVAGRNYPPTNKNTLIRALTEEWDKLPQQLLDNVVQRKCLQIRLRITVLFPTLHNDPKHTADIVKLWLLYNIPDQLHTPLESPDQNPIEHPWDLLERRIRQHNISSKYMLKSILKDEWERISAEETIRFVN
ncbi:transposable element Tc1 transposase [Trichonephila clavipes]|nr:transposable element Tc1 transposase [Trichonephila clavipes]